MSKLKVRKKKFNPNKVSPAATRQYQHDASLRRDMTQKFPMEMEYVGHHVHEYIERKKLDEKELFDLFSDSKTLPFHIALGAYDWQNMGIVLVLDHIKPCEWFIHTNIHLMNIHEEETNMVTVPYEQRVPEMHHCELWQGKADAKVDLGMGLKKVGWKGLKQELADAIDARKDIPDGHAIECMQIYISADVEFKSLAAYKEYLAVTSWLKQGTAVAERNLRSLWVQEQYSAQLNGQGYGVEHAV
ncbi:hypothetical protein ABVS_3024 [Acinetobacter lwoffii]|uniref:hypothetical protein n=1 Tax=Acinetobacter lwoffii TaxID=28090 RepID=UPI001C92C85B|nr:hypothetical protein [Acinetobacter lwoffii]QZM13650.1 hypothetical protein ABVS_3024 [Acinetobacter lwoffii]